MTTTPKLVERFAWTMTGMRVSDLAFGPMRYIREVDYDALLEQRAAKIAALERDARRWNFGLEHGFPQYKVQLIRSERPYWMAFNGTQGFKGESANEAVDAAIDAAGEGQ